MSCSHARARVQAWYLSWLREALGDDEHGGAGGVMHVRRRLAGWADLDDLGPYRAVFNCTGARRSAQTDFLKSSASDACVRRVQL